MESDIVHRLLHWAYTICTFNKAQVARDAAAEIQRLRAELAAAIKQRDEARRELCRVIGYQRQDRFDATAIAAERGWDCFAQQEGGGA